jgi:hypothetical protein
VLFVPKPAFRFQKNKMHLMNPNSLKLSRKYIKRRTILRCYQNGEKLLRQKVAKNVFPENLIFSIIFDEAKNYFF